MNSTLSVGVTLVVACVSGIAIWQHDALAAGARAAAHARGPANDPAPTEPRIGAEEDLARSLLQLLDEGQRARAVVAEEVLPSVMLRAAVPPAALGAQGGLPWSAMTQAQRAVVRRLLERLAETLCGNSAASELARIAPEDPLCFAWAGGLDRGMYCRLHGEHFSVEYVRLPGGLGVHAAWRHFERDAGAPWLCDQLPATRAR